MRPSIFKVAQIDNGFLAVMAKPVAGEWINDEFKGIAETGVNKIVSLLESQEAYDVGLQDEQTLVESLGMRFLHYPIADRGLPQSVAAFGELAKQLYNDITIGVNTVIHCRAGIGRTGILAAGVLLHCGYDSNAAFAHVSEKRGVQVPDTEQQERWLHENQNEILAA